MKSGEDSHEGRFARAVFSQKTVYFTRQNLKRNPGESFGAAETLCDVGYMKNRERFTRPRS
jgi:hypothetical protein